MNFYADNFAPPIPWGEPGYFTPNRKDPNNPAMSLEYYCYSEPMKDLERIISEIESLVKQLMLTKNKTLSLYSSVREDKTDLTGLNGAFQKNAKESLQEKGYKSNSSGVSSSKKTNFRGKKLHKKGLQEKSRSGISKKSQKAPKKVKQKKSKTHAFVPAGKRKFSSAEIEAQNSGILYCSGMTVWEELSQGGYRHLLRGPKVV